MAQQPSTLLGTRNSLDRIAGTINGLGRTGQFKTSNGKSLNTHTHGNVQTGSGNTGPPN
jgi:hypothetical protein